MYTLTIAETTDTADEMADLLEHLAAQIRDGYTSGVYPHWSLDGDEPAPRPLPPVPALDALGNAVG